MADQSDESKLLQVIIQKHKGYCRVRDLRKVKPDISTENILQSRYRQISVFRNENDDDQSVVFANIKSLRLCAYGPRRCRSMDQCPHLHLCQAYLLGICHFGQECWHGHEIIHNEHNRRVVRQSGVDELCEDEDILLGVARYSNAMVCLEHNAVEGPNCPDPASCLRLHVCNEFVLNGECPLTAAYCKLGHELFRGRNRKVLALYGIKEPPTEYDKQFVMKRIVKVNLTDYKYRSTADDASSGEKYRSTADDASSHEKYRSTADDASSGEKYRSTADDASSHEKYRSTADDASSGEKYRSTADNASSHEKSAQYRTVDGSGSGCEEYEEHSCDDGNGCRVRHDAEPFLWRLKQQSEWPWWLLNDSRAIEETFCDPRREFFRTTNSPTTLTINFETMTWDAGVIQRLSTPSYVTCRNTVDATVWRWYWNDGDEDTKVWRCYEEDELPYQDVLEAKFIHDKQQACCFERDDTHYMIDFVEMKETNMETGFKRDIRRRPVFQSASARRRLPFSYHFHADKLPVNERWVPMNTEEIGFTEFVPVDKDRRSNRHIYKEVSDEFHRTMSGREYRIKSLFRIQNLDLWKKYLASRCVFESRTSYHSPIELMENLLRVWGHGPLSTSSQIFLWRGIPIMALRIKTEMEKGWTDSSTPFEYRLFHGAADEDTVREICHQNFDPQMHRAHDTPYGKGAYFASTALNGHLNARSAARTGCRYMFFARVLIGQRTNGKGEYRQPPPIDPKRSFGARYNSCVDDKDHPTIFVVFDRDQCYPEYVIEYEDLRHPAFNKKPSSSSDAGCSVM